jgi:cytochrome c551/c552
MVALTHRRATLTIILVLLLSLALAGCGADPSADVISPQLGQQLVARAQNAEIEVEPTPEPLEIADLSEEEIAAGLPDDFAAALANASADSGETVALTNGCIGCHALDPDQQMTGPTWFDVADTAVNRVPDQSPALYLYTSIVQPNAHIVEGYPQNIMPQNYSDLLSQEDLADVVAYLLTQHE